MSRRTAPLAALALAGVSVAAALSLARVFTDGGFVVRVVGAALLPHAVGAATRGRRWALPVTLAATVLALACYGLWVFAPETTWFGVPGRDTAPRVAELLAEGWRVFRRGVAPVTSDSAIVLLAAGAAAASATVADVAAFRRDATIGALVPSLLLFVIAATLGTGELRMATTVAYVVAALVFLLLANQSRLEARRAWATGRRLGSAAAVVNAGLVVGGVALVVGMIVGPALPGADAGPLFDYRAVGGRAQGGAADVTALSPIVDIRSRLLDQPDTELFTVEAPTRLYWRIAALDTFDGEVWGISSEARAAKTRLPRRPRAGTVRQQYTIGPLTDRWLPAAYAAEAITLSGTRVIPESGTLLAPDDATGLRYRVDSRVPPRTLDAVTARATETELPPARFSELELPDGFPAEARALARRAVRGASNPYERARALQAFFLDGSFTYDLEVAAGSGTDAITDFLTRRRGFCEQFAGTYAAMARAVGLPARVAVGFAPGQFANGRFSVRARDAHAWPEVWLAGVGWTLFEPTPAGTAPGMADAALGSPAVAPGTVATGPGATTPTTARSPAQPDLALPADPAPGRVEVGAGTADGGTGWDLRWLAPGALALGVVFALAIYAYLTAAGKRRRRVHRRSARTPEHSVTGAWQDALERLADAGLPPSRALTPNEQAASYRSRGIPTTATEPLQRLAVVYARARWSGREPSPAAAREAWASADAVRDALAVGVGGRERARRALHREPESVG